MFDTIERNCETAYKLTPEVADRVEHLVAETLDESCYDKTIPVDIVKIARNMGFEVGNAPLKNDTYGFIAIDENTNMIMGVATNKLIAVKADLSVEMKRFTIAHEIGHYRLHYLTQKSKEMYAHRDRYKFKEEKSISEQEADYFAACILMPKDVFVDAYRKMEKSVSKDSRVFALTKKFEVSTTAVERRIFELGLDYE